MNEMLMNSRQIPLLRLTLLSLALVITSGISVHAATAKINNFWIEAANQNGVEGLRLHVDFNVVGMRGISTGVEIDFFDQNGNIWTASATDGINKKNSQIYRKKIVTPNYDNSRFKDEWFFVRLDQLQLKYGTHKYYCCAFVTDEHVSPNRILSKSPLCYFTAKYMNGGATGYAGNRTYYSFADPSGSSSGNASSSYANNGSSSKSNSSVSAGEALLTLGAIAAAGAGVISALSGNSSSSSSSSNSTVNSVYSLNNVEIVDWWTMGSLALSHAKVQIRNKNNYDVIVHIDFYQKKWYVGRIIYSDYERSDRLPGVSDEFKEDIKVPANSIRTVYLKTSGSGRPTHVRILSVH